MLPEHREWSPIDGMNMKDDASALFVLGFDFARDFGGFAEFGDGKNKNQAHSLVCADRNTFIWQIPGLSYLQPTGSSSR